MSPSPLDPTPVSSSEPTVEEEESWLLPGAWLLDLMAEITLGPHQPPSAEEPLAGDAAST